jgi:hypothetical protein
MINIKNIKDIVFIGDIIKHTTKSTNKWRLDYKCDKIIQRKENGRVYFIVVDNKIYKIGSSECKVFFSSVEKKTFPQIKVLENILYGIFKKMWKNGLKK